MILITGGAYQGKSRYAKSLFPEATMTDTYPTEGMLRGENPLIWCNLETYTKEFLEKDPNPDALYASIENVIEQKKNLVLIGREIGNGVVPMEESVRFYRENYGRLMMRLGSEAEKVVRVLCGIGMEIS